MLTTLAGDPQVIVLDAATVTKRSQITDKLSRARPDLVAPSYAQRRTWRLSRSMRTEVREHHWDGLPNATMVNMTAQAAAPDCSLPSIGTFEDDSGMDWERSHVLADNILAQLRRGEPVSLPALACLNSQHPDEH
jgi:DNA cross-link repair 1C protein